MSKLMYKVLIKRVYHKPFELSSFKKDGIMPVGDTKIVIDYLDDMWILLFINERGNLGSVNYYWTFNDLINRLKQLN